MCCSLIFHANQTGMYIFEPIFINVNKPFDVTKLSIKEVPGLQKQLSLKYMYCKLDTAT